MGEGSDDGKAAGRGAGTEAGTGTGAAREMELESHSTNDTSHHASRTVGMPEMGFLSSSSGNDDAHEQQGGRRGGVGTGGDRNNDAGEFNPNAGDDVNAGAGGSVGGVEKMLVALTWSVPIPQAQRMKSPA